jgi:hypothetical protein
VTRIHTNGAVDVHVGGLRAKRGLAGDQVETVVGFGYPFVNGRRHAEARTKVVTVAGTTCTRVLV